MTTCLMEIAYEEPILFISLHSSRSASKSGNLTVTEKRQISPFLSSAFIAAPVYFVPIKTAQQPEGNE